MNNLKVTRRGFEKLDKIIGAAMFVVGVLVLMHSQSGITGNVVSERVDAVSSVISLAMIIGGLGMMSSGRLEDLAVRNRGVDFSRKQDIDWVLKRTRQKTFGGHENILVLDAAGLIDYKNDLDKIFTDPGITKIYVPEEVIDEVRKDYLIMPKLLKFKDKINWISPKDFRIFKKKATEVLHRTSKHQLYEKARKRIEGREHDILYSPWENSEIEKVRDKLEISGGKADDYDVLEQLARHYQAEGGDVGVLGAAMFEATKGNNVNILTCDKHLSESLDILKQENLGVGRHMRYHNYLRKAK